MPSDIETNTVSEIQKLEQLGQQRLHLVRVAKELSLQQTEYMQSDNIDQLLSLLAKKSEVIDGLAAIHQALKPFQRQPGSERSWPSDDSKASCQRSFDEADRLLRELVAMDELAIDELTAHCEIIAGQLTHYAAASSIHHAYETHNLETDINQTFLSLEG